MTSHLVAFLFSKKNEAVYHNKTRVVVSTPTGWAWA